MRRNVCCVSSGNSLNTIQQFNRYNGEAVFGRYMVRVFMLGAEVHIFEQVFKERCQSCVDISGSARCRIENIAKIAISFKQRQIVRKISRHIDKSLSSGLLPVVVTFCSNGSNGSYLFIFCFCYFE